MGDIFEHMLERIQTSGQNGQFRTPRQIIRFMIELLDPEITCFNVGTPDTLLEAGNFIKRMQEREGKKIGCIEEMASEMGYIEKL